MMKHNKFVAIIINKSKQKADNQQHYLSATLSIK